MKTLKSLFFCLIFLLGMHSNTLAAPKSQATLDILYVKTTGTSINSCANWADACDLQSALNYIGPGYEVWVAAGMYKPTTGTERGATFQLKNGVELYGGFPETGEPTWEQRDWEAHPSVLSGDIGTAGNSSDNSYHVVTGSGVDGTAILDGFTISGGNANGSDPHDSGGGIYNFSGSPTLINLTISSNSADYGGGMYNLGSSPTLTNVTFSGNTATTDGGGMYNTNIGSPNLTNVTFSSNNASYGGGMYNIMQSSPTLTNVTFSSNTASKNGGGMYNNIVSNPSLTNVTFSSNTAEWNGGGMYNDMSSPLTVNNGILWGNSPDQIVNNYSYPTITYSVVQGGCPSGASCNNIITDDPFLGPLADNGGFTQTHMLFSGSPAIDAASPTVCPPTDQRGYPRPIDGDGIDGPRCDMGTYEYGSQAITLTVETIGSGTVAMDPEKTEYEYGENVVLTANASPGSSFDSWSGDVSGTENPKTILMEKSSHVTAHFTQDEYTLTVLVDPIDSGSVTINPLQTTYHYGDVVALTSTASRGWIFSDWAGDASGSDHLLAYTIVGNTNFTATFSQDEYTLTVEADPVGSGTVAVDPLKITYHYGEQVTLTPTAMTGWSFVGWDFSVVNEQLSDLVNSLSFNITGDTTIKAKFIQVEYKLYLPMILRQ
jgi:predicted outer membrane repeat protein